MHNFNPMNLIKTEGMTHAEWEKVRKNLTVDYNGKQVPTCGGSDAAVIVLGTGKFGRTKLDLYNTKIGLTPTPVSGGSADSPDSRIIFDAGHFLESLVAEIFAYRTGYEIFKYEYMVQHPNVPFLVGNVDRLYKMPGVNVPKGVLEIKTTSENNPGWNGGGIPEEYVVQVAEYMSIMNLPEARIACLKISETLRAVAGTVYQMVRVFESLPQKFVSDMYDTLKGLHDPMVEPFIPVFLGALSGEFVPPENESWVKTISDAVGDAFILRAIERDETLEGELISKTTKFWDEHIVPGIPPTLDDEKGSAAIATYNKWIAPKAAPAILLPNGGALEAAYDIITDCKEQKKALNQRAKVLDGRIEKETVKILEALNGAKKATFIGNDGVYDVSYERGKPRVSIPKDNLQRLENQFPYVYDKFAETKEGTASLKVKKRKETKI